MTLALPRRFSRGNMFGYYLFKYFFYNLVSQQHTFGAKLIFFAQVMVMGKVEIIEQEIQALSTEELERFRAWFLEFDWAAWDRQLERDVSAGKLDALAEKALRDHASGKTTPL